MDSAAENASSLIAVDWGSTHLRAKLVVDGEVCASAHSADGIRNLGGRDCATILESLCGDWKRIYPGAQVIASGMVGAREGWIEAPYVQAPCELGDLVTGLVTISTTTFGEISIVPGVRIDDEACGLTDVMRGEETQIAGLLSELAAEEAVVCLPGTHSKWVLCRQGRIEDFRTWFTGEAYELLTHGSLVSGDGSPAVVGSPAFLRGMDSVEALGGLLRQIFLGRTHMLAGRLAPHEIRSYISGLLLAHELREGLAYASGLPLLIVGDSPSAEAVSIALEHRGAAFRRITRDVHLDGIRAIHAHRQGVAPQ